VIVIDFHLFTILSSFLQKCQMLTKAKGG